jgi:hypothetical protein
MEKINDRIVHVPSLSAIVRFGAHDYNQMGDAVQLPAEFGRTDENSNNTSAVQINNLIPICVYHTAMNETDSSGDNLLESRFSELRCHTRHLLLSYTATHKRAFCLALAIGHQIDSSELSLPATRHVHDGRLAVKMPSDAYTQASSCRVAVLTFKEWK